MSGSLLEQFSELHRSGHFIIPNPWDVGSARVLQTLGFKALATTSSGFAASLGKSDQQVTLDELLDHVSAICSAVEIPVSVDAEFGFAVEPDGLAQVVKRIADTGAVGFSIEDYVPGRGVLGEQEAVDRVGRVVDAADGGLVITARAENHLYGLDDLDDTVGRLRAYSEVGAHVLYAPFLRDIEHFKRLASELAKPINALLLPRGPSVGELAEAGVRRMSTGGGLAFSAYGLLERASKELLESGTSGYRSLSLSSEVVSKAFRDVD